MTLRIVISCLLVGACGVDVDRTDDELDVDLAELRGGGSRLVQPGVRIVLLEVTDDNHAIYQAGQQVFATALGRGAEPELIADVPAGNTAFVFQSGRVAFVWTNPDRTAPGFGVSPLVIWSAATGAHLASESSAIGTLATAASADGDRVLFTTGSPAGNNATGDLELASTDLSERETFAAGIAMAFPAGPCVPRASFLGERDTVVAITCPAGATTATLTMWDRGERRQLAEPLAAPPRLRIDPDRERITTLLAGTQHPIVVDRQLRTTVVAEVQAANSFFGGDGAVLYFGQPAATGLRPVFRARGDREPRQVAELFGLYFLGFGSTALSLPVTSPDGRHLLYFDVLEPTFGLGANVIRSDVRSDAPPVTLDTSPANGVFGVPFTRDSDYALYARFDTTNFAVGPMFAAGPRGNRAFSDDLGWSWDPAFRSTITYNDNTVLDLTNLAVSTADLKSVDLSRKTLAPHLIAEQANITYFASHRGRGVVYTIDTGDDAGLYVACVP